MSLMKPSNFHRERSKEALRLIIQNNKTLPKAMTSHYFKQIKSQRAPQSKFYILKQRSVLLLILRATSTNKPLLRNAVHSRLSTFFLKLPSVVFQTWLQIVFAKWHKAKGL